MATDTAKRAGPTAITVAEVTVYTVPGSTSAVLRNIHIANTTASAVVIKASIGADAAGTRILSDVSIPANGTFDWSGFLPMLTTETFRSQGATTGCTMTLGIIETA